MEGSYQSCSCLTESKALEQPRKKVICLCKHRGVPIRQLWDERKKVDSDLEHVNFNLLRDEFRRFPQERRKQSKQRRCLSSVREILGNLRQNPDLPLTKRAGHDGDTFAPLHQQSQVGQQ